MSDADDAYAAAERWIEEARAGGKKKVLSLAHKDCAALTRLPDSLATLPDLKSLILGNRNHHVAVSDLTPLAQLTGLTTLDLNNTPVTDLTPLAQITGLTALTLNDTQVNDLTPLAQITGLSRLFFDNTRVSDLTPLEQLTGLTTIELRGTQVADLTPLAGLTGLITLNLTNTQVADLTPLAQLTGLTTLYLNSTKIKDLSPLSQLTELKALSTHNTRVSDLAPLTQITGLRKLNVANTRVSNLIPLARITRLGTLYLTNNEQVTDVAPLAHITRLKRLTLTNTSVMDLRPLRGLLELAAAPISGGLTIRGSAAALSDQRIAEIARVEDARDRAAQLFAYLDTLPPWPEPLPGQDGVPEDAAQVPAFELPDRGPMRSTDTAPEGGDEDQEALRLDLMRKIGAVIEAIGDSNELAGLKQSAEHYRGQISREMAAIRITLLYSAANTLRTAHEADQSAKEQGRINDELPAKVAGPLQDAVETHALFFMGFPNAARVHQEMLAGLTGQRHRDEVAAAEPIVTSLEGKDQALEPDDQAAMADDLAAAQGEGPSAEIGEISLRGRLWNMLGAFGRKVYAVGLAGAGVITSHYFVQWVVANEVAVRAWLKMVQGAASGWFDRVMEMIRVVLGG